MILLYYYIVINLEEAKIFCVPIFTQSTTHIYVNTFYTFLIHQEKELKF